MSMRVAAPNLNHAKRPSPMSSSVTIQRLKAPALLSHFATSKPSTLSSVANAKPPSESATKYAGEAACAPLPQMNSALPAMKYSSAGKYGRLLHQYVHPVINPAKGPNARLLHTYIPPSSG